jgi:hypothetical protein
MLNEARSITLTTHQNPIPRLLSGWALTLFYFWVSPDGKQTNEAICREEVKPCWERGWLKLQDGRIVLNSQGRVEAQEEFNVR